MLDHEMPTTAKGQCRDYRPGLAIIVNVLAPYRIHLHERIASEIPELKLHTIVTHAKAEVTWEVDCPASINAVYFASEDDHVVHSPVRRLLRDWVKAGRIMAYLCNNDVKAVIVLGYFDLTRLRILQLCRGANIRLFLRGDSNIRSDLPKGWLHRIVKKTLVRWVIRRCDAVMPVGTLGQAYFEKYGARSDQCILVPFEPDYSAFRKTKDGPPIPACKKKYNLVPDQQYILFSGRLVTVKRVDLLIDAFARIAAERPNWDLLIVGDGPLRQELERRAPAALRSRVHWLGFLQMEELIPVYHVASILVLPSDFEPWALVINEALAAGLVAVASDVVGAAYDLIQDGVNGRVFPSGNLDALAEALKDVTAEDRFGDYQKAVVPVLDAWRQRADPVEGVRKALRRVEVMA